MRPRRARGREPPSVLLVEKETQASSLPYAAGMGVRGHRGTWRAPFVWGVVVASIQWLRPFSRAAVVHAHGAEGELFARLVSLLSSLLLAGWAAGRMRAGGARFARGLGRSGAAAMGLLALLAAGGLDPGPLGGLLYLVADGWSALWVALAWHQFGVGSSHRGPQMARAGIGGLLGGLFGGVVASAWAPGLPLWGGLVPVAIVSPWLGRALADLASETPKDGGSQQAHFAAPAGGTVPGRGALGALLLAVASAEALAQLLDYRAVRLATAHLGEEGAVRAFFGGIAAGASVLGLLAQLFWTRWAGGRRRAVLGLLSVPLGVLVLLGAASFVASALPLAALLVVFDRGLGHSIHQSAREQLLGRLPGDPGAVRPWGSSVVPRFGRVAGVGLALAASAFGPSALSWSSAATALLSAVASLWLGWRLVACSTGSNAGQRLEGWLLDSLRLSEPMDPSRIEPGR